LDPKICERRTQAKLRRSRGIAWDAKENQSPNQDQGNKIMAGRGKKKIVSEEDMLKAESYALENCKTNTICQLMGWHQNFVEDHPEIKKRLQVKRAEHAETIRKSQFNHVKNPVMAMFLGKNVLGQADKQEITGLL
jgi:hypothetical protein